VSWIIATRLVDPAEIGKASQFVSALLLVAGAVQLNLDVGLLRWLPGAGRHAGRLVWRTLLLVMLLAAVVGLVYALLLPSVARSAAGGASPWFGVALFVLAAAGWSVFTLHDSVLVALGRPWWTVWRNGAFAVGRIRLLVALGGLGFGAQGIVLSWVGSIVLWIAAGTVVLAVLLQRSAVRSAEGSLPSRREVVGFLGPTAVARSGTVLLYDQIPVLVVVRYGDATGGRFFLVWQALVVVDVAATFFMNALSLGVAQEPDQASRLAAVARRRLLKVFLPLLALGALVAAPALELVFGAAYAEAADVLRLLLAGMAFRLIVLHELGVRQALGRAMAYARLQLTSTVLVTAVVVAVPVGRGTVADLLPVAIGYVLVQALCMLAVLTRPALRRLTRVTPRHDDDLTHPTHSPR
jgi:O-antigen/teichoic acid export membrane protein